MNKPSWLNQIEAKIEIKLAFVVYNFLGYIFFDE